MDTFLTCMFYGNILFPAASRMDKGCLWPSSKKKKRLLMVRYGRYGRRRSSTLEPGYDQSLPIITTNQPINTDDLVLWSSPQLHFSPRQGILFDELLDLSGLCNQMCTSCVCVCLHGGVCQNGPTGGVACGGQDEALTLACLCCCYDSSSTLSRQTRRK